jgi:hypothetical protein
MDKACSRNTGFIHSTKVEEVQAVSIKLKWKYGLYSLNLSLMDKACVSTLV